MRPLVVMTTPAMQTDPDTPISDLKTEMFGLAYSAHLKLCWEVSDVIFVLSDIDSDIPSTQLIPVCKKNINIGLSLLLYFLNRCKPRARQGKFHSVMLIWQ